MCHADVVEADAGAHYRVGRMRLSELLAELPDDTWATPVPACPGWDVHAVVAHLVANIEDGMAGRLTGPPDDTQTAAQVARHAADRPDALLERWTDMAPLFEDFVSAGAIWPATLDVLTHEHDIRAAIGAPVDRTDPLVRLAAELLVERRQLPQTVVFDVGDARLTTLPADGPSYEVMTSAFEVCRLCLGRRSAAQVVAMDWRPALPAVPDGLFIFGPRDTPLVE